MRSVRSRVVVTSTTDPHVLMFTALRDYATVHRVWRDNWELRALCGFKPKWGWFIFQMPTAPVGSQLCQRCLKRVPA